MEAAFVAWLTERGGFVNPKLSLFSLQGDGDRGVTVREDVEEGEQLLLVPLSATLHLAVDDTSAPGARLPATCRPELAAFLEEQRPPLSPFIATALMLLAETGSSLQDGELGSGGSGGGFAPYFATLPEGDTHCLINWSDDERAALAGTSLDLPGAAPIGELFERDIAPRLAAAPQLFPAPLRTAAAFRRAADMVQTRAFHMAKDNWLTGATEEATEELYLIPAVDMLNHASRPERRNARLALLRGGGAAAGGGGDGDAPRCDCFTMRAERAIPAGGQVLHTYGDLGDAQLLQTYGFIDAPPVLPGAAGGAAAAAEEAGEAGGWLNPASYVVLPLRALLAAADKVGRKARLWRSKHAQELFAAKLALLAKEGLLAGAGAGGGRIGDAQLLVTAAEPLPDALLTIVQVLVMTAPEFEQLLEAQEEAAAEEAAEAAAAAAGADAADADGGGDGAVGDGGAAGKAPLSLGRAMLRGEFAERCSAVLVEVAARCSARYAWRSAGDAAAAMAAAPCGGRAWLAAALVAGEQQLLAHIRRGAVMLMLEQGSDDDDSDGSDGGGGGSDDGSSSSSDKGEDEGAAAAAAAAEPRRRRRGAGAAGGDAKRARRGDAADGAAGAPAGKGKHGGRQGEAGRAGARRSKRGEAGGATKDSRPHYGAMTGPEEEEIWQSDDSDKVGYSSDDSSDGGGSDAAPRPRGGGAGGARHTYEVGAGGAVREAHGHMLGPDEADLLESDDSDKVGYADEGDGGADGGADGAEGGAAGAAARRRAARGAARAGARRRAGGTAAASQRPKRGLGFKP
ncbi:setd6 [Scenedesmus sp. PABB004]|nr:setd6 [Scenedesmus sp. PABB004]